MPIITLTTDFGLKDPYVGALKGTIFSKIPDITIVDISHQISPFNAMEAAYVIRNAYESFPEGSIHIIGVDIEQTPEKKHIVALINNHYFICPDNGIISLIAADNPLQKVVEITIHNKVVDRSAMATFVFVASHIAKGGALEILGKPLSSIVISREMQPFIHENTGKIIGSVVYIDNYGNIISNITRDLFQVFRKERDFEVLASRYVFNKIHDTYSGFVDFSIDKQSRYDDGKKLALFNQSGFLEIALYRSNLTTVGGASSLLGLKYRDQITIKFKDIV